MRARNEVMYVRWYSILLYSDVYFSNPVSESTSDYFKVTKWVTQNTQKVYLL